jgi:hypothetical protein
MPHAAPGVTARDALRRKIPGDSKIPGRSLVWYMDGYSSWSGTENFSRSNLQRYKGKFLFIEHSSGLWVDHGRLGEVRSLVGDCRPPPPDNPRQPTKVNHYRQLCGWLWNNPISCNGFMAFIRLLQKNGELFLPVYQCLSFKYPKYLSNLKKVVLSQYFKNDCSFFSCNVKSTVLEFVSSHYHLYGFRLVGPPSIAITYVLIT